MERCLFAQRGNRLPRKEQLREVRMVSEGRRKAKSAASQDVHPQGESNEAMSKYRYWWRPNVERLLKTYPALKAMQAAAKNPTLTARYGGQPGGGGISRGTENLALKTPLTAREQEAVEAVDKAIEEIRRQRDGETVLKIVTMVDFKRSHTIEGAAMVLYMHRVTASDKRTRFIDTVGKNLGWLNK